MGPAAGVGRRRRAVVAATGVLAGPASGVGLTLLDDAVATQDTVTQLISAIRRGRRHPRGRRGEVAAHDYDSSGKPPLVWDDPDAKAALVSGLVNDALAIIAASRAWPLMGPKRTRSACWH